jgi:hypothetical protein
VAAVPSGLSLTPLRIIIIKNNSPEVTADDGEWSLKEQLSLKKYVCTRLKTKIITYASFHVSVIENEFPLIRNTDIWPTGYLIAPSNGKLTPDQAYSTSTAAPGDTAHPNSSNRELGGSPHAPNNRFEPQRFRFSFIEMSGDVEPNVLGLGTSLRF